MTVKGGDFSHYNSTLPDGLDFYFHKCTEGSSYVDNTYASRQQWARRHGYQWGAYHFFRMNASAGAQVQNFVNHAAIQQGDIVALDFEDSPVDPWSAHQPSQIGQHATGVISLLMSLYPHNRILLYCNESTLASYVERFGIPVGDGLWIADPRKRPDTFLFWQYTDTPYDADLSDAFTNVDSLRAWALSKGDDMTPEEHNALFDIREQLCGSRTLGEYPGWEQLGNHTVVDALGVVGQTVWSEPLKTPGWPDPNRAASAGVILGNSDLHTNTIVEAVQSLQRQLSDLVAAVAKLAGGSGES